MKLSLRSLLAPSLALSLTLSAPVVSADDKTNTANWQMFAHFVNVAQPEQAKPFGESLLSLSNAEFLKAIESDPLHKIKEIQKGGISEALKPVWDKIEDKYQDALTERSRDEAQIRADIAELGKGLRAQYLAIERLKTTGQFAAPYYVQTLQDATKSDLHPRAINAMVEVGRELAYPLAVALPYVDPATQVNLARVLGDIGYPEALPYLKQVIEGPASANVKRACQGAFSQIVDSAGIDAAGSAADLFVRLGQLKYAVGTRNGELLGMDLANKTGIIWRYNTTAGLIGIAVNETVFADSLSMQNAAAALQLNKDMDQAVTLHLAANLRRENRLGGEKDPGYKLPNPASFYMLISGAPQQKAVLTRALTDGDTALALDAIEAMSDTVGNNVLLGNDEARAPVLDALYYADRRVRFTAAITLASAAPAEAFSGSMSVVPVLGQAVRQSDTLNAMVIAPGGADVLTTAMENIEFDAVGDVDIDRASAKAVSKPGIDLIVYSGDFAGFEALHAAVKADGYLSVSPILALVDEGVAAAISVNYPDIQTAAAITEADSEAEADRLERLAKQTITKYGGDPIGDDEAEAYAEAALALLRTIAAHESIYNAGDVEPVLIEALNDDRSSVAIGAAQVLELMDTDAAQQALAAAGISRVGEVKIAILNALAESSKNFGNKLNRATTSQLIDLIAANKGNATALAAGRALGSLTERPTSDTTGFILGE